jgi:hypothetical protein
MWITQGSEIGRARGLCLANVESFYKSLSEAYEAHRYPPSQNWKCDEFGAQTNQNGGALVLAQTDSSMVHSIMPYEYEWLSMLSCINALDEHSQIFTFLEISVSNEISLPNVDHVQ